MSEKNFLLTKHKMQYRFVSIYCLRLHGNDENANKNVND